MLDLDFFTIEIYLHCKKISKVALPTQWRIYVDFHKGRAASDKVGERGGAGGGGGSRWTTCVLFVLMRLLKAF